jgi:hypothetical protein
MGAIEKTTQHLPVVGSMYRNAKRALLVATGAATMWAGYYSWNNFVPPKVKRTICNYIGFTSLEEDIEKNLREKFDLVEEEPKKKVGEKSDASTKTLNEIVV